MTRRPSPPSPAPVVQHEFTIHGDAPFTDVESLLQLAIFSIEGLFGAAAVRMSVAYVLDDETRTVTIGTDTVAGDATAKAFTSLLIREIGERAFSVRRIDDGDDGDGWPPEECAGLA